MNCIVLFHDDFVDATRVRLRDERAGHIIRVLKGSVGKVFKVGKVNGGIGRGEVVSIGPDGVELQVLIPEAILHPPEVSLIVALPRPQTLKKVLETAATFGVRRLILTRAARVEKSYFSSGLLREENLLRHLKLGLEQRGGEEGETLWLPQTSIHRSFGEMIGEIEKFPSSVRLLCHPSTSSVSLLDSPAAMGGESGGEVLCAIGPEGGWIDREVERFTSLRFLPVHLGPVRLRVEQAVTALLSLLGLFKPSFPPPPQQGEVFPSIPRTSQR